MELSRWAIPVASWLAGLGSALLLDFRHNRRRTRTVAGALQVEVARLRSAVGPRRERLIVGNFFGLSRGVPSIHPWVERIVTEGAEIDASVVEAFMTLDSELANMRTYHDLFVQAAQKGTLARQTTDEVRKLILQEWINERDVAALLARQPDERPQDFEQASEFAEYHYLACYDGVVAVLDQLDGRLGRLTKRVASPATLPPAIP